MVAGDLVNTACRLQSVAPPGTVLVGEATQRAASRAIAFEQAGEQLLKGKPAPVPAWRALRVVAERGGRNRAEGARGAVRRARRRAPAPQGPVPRHRARTARPARLRHRARPASARAASPGSSSSTSTACVETVYWHEGRSPGVRRGITFWALGEMVRRRAGLVETDDEPTTRATDRRDARRVRARRGRAALDRAGAARPARRSATRRAGGRDELFAAWRTFFERIADRARRRSRVRGPPLGRPGPARLHRPPPGVVDRNSRSSSSPSPGPSCSIGGPTGAPAGATSSRSHSSRSPSAAMRQLLAGLVPGLPESAVARDPRAGRRDPAVRGRDGPDARRGRAARARRRRLSARRRPRPTLAVPESLHALIAARLDALDPADRSLAPGRRRARPDVPAAALAALIRADDRGARDPPAGPRPPRDRRPRHGPALARSAASSGSPRP